MKEKLYTIGEVSKLANISIKTLRYYDKIQLFTPVYVDPHTNYRYYKDSQLYQLDLIKSLKYIGIPLEEIKHIQNMKKEDFYHFILDQERIVREKVEYLLEIEQTIKNVKKRIERQKKFPALGEVFMTDEEDIRIIRMKAEGVDPANILNASYSKLKKFAETADGFINHGYGAIFPYRQYSAIEGIAYEYLFTPLLTNKQISMLAHDTEVVTLPGGKYVCIIFNYQSSDYYFDNFQKLISYIDEQKLAVISDIYELFTQVHYLPQQQEEYLIELRVQVEGPQK